jgi:hypothetical protein
LGSAVLIADAYDFPLFVSSKVSRAMESPKMCFGCGLVCNTVCLGIFVPGRPAQPPNTFIGTAIMPTASCAEIRPVAQYLIRHNLHFRH